MRVPRATSLLTCLFVLSFLLSDPVVPGNRSALSAQSTGSTTVSGAENRSLIRVEPDMEDPHAGRMERDGTTEVERDSPSVTRHAEDGLASEAGGRVAELASGEVVPYQIIFNWPDSGAITMVDACSQEAVATPEYDADAGTNNPAAFVRGGGPLAMRVKWRAASKDLSKATVWASGGLGGVVPVEVSFVGGESDWISMATRKSMPDGIRSSQLTFHWKYKVGTAGAMDGATTSHVIYTLNRAPTTSPVYVDLVRWTTEWCQVLKNPGDKAVADAILQGFASSGVIHYATSASYDTPSILCNGGGMCGGMTEVFYDACGTQGVHVARSCYILRDADPGRQDKWASILIFAPGLGNARPTFRLRAIRAVNKVYPCPRYYEDSSSEDDVRFQRRRAYEFYAPDDGHCINFLTTDGAIYLYDLSFGTGPFNNTFSTLPYDLKSGKELAHFRKVYFNDAIDHMRGQISFKTPDAPCAFDAMAPYLDVKTSLVPYDPASLALFWYTAE